MMKKPEEQKLQDAIYIPSNPTFEEFERYTRLGDELPTEEDISETDIIREFEKSKVFLSESNDTENDDSLFNPVSFAKPKQSLENICKFMEQNN
ncbi:hypothetical protein HZS_1467, partial [Henneguya salminicola]